MRDHDHDPQRIHTTLIKPIWILKGSHMSTFAAAVVADATSPSLSGVTANGGAALATSQNALVDLFFVVGSSRGKDLTQKFLAALNADPQRAITMLFWARDVRGGAGERDTFRKLMCVLETARPDLVQKVIPLIPEYGRWDDLDAFQTPEARDQALNFWCAAILAGHGLASKWSPRRGALANELRKRMKLDPKSYRKLLVTHTQVVENHMCARTWGDINYSHVPSVAAARYQKVFTKRDTERYAAFKAAAVKGDVKINAGALYPYDVLKSIRMGDETAALAQWNALPNYLGDAGFILPVIDTSGSMQCPVGDTKSKLSCLDVAISLGLYLADKQQGAFANMFLNFDSDSKIHHLQGNLLEKLHQIEHAAWGGSTNLESAFKEILRVAVMGNVPQSEMPRYLLVISDMGLNPIHHNASVRAFDLAKQMFDRHNYQLPIIVWWNVAHRSGGYGGDNNFPVGAHEQNTALVSGFSPAIMKSVLAAKSVSPWDVMMETLDQPRYQAVRDALAT